MLKKFIELTLKRQVQKVTDLLIKGTDPNFHDEETGETPLTIATAQDDVDMVTNLVEGGVRTFSAVSDWRPCFCSKSLSCFTSRFVIFVIFTNRFPCPNTNLQAFTDFRSKDGMSPVHKAAVKGAHRTLKALLDLRASPDVQVREIPHRY